MELAKRKESIFCTVYFVRRKFFKNLWFISMHSVLNTLSEYTYFYKSKNITSYMLLLTLKLVESLQCILNYEHFWRGDERPLKQNYLHSITSPTWNLANYSNILSSQEKSLRWKEVSTHTDTFTQHWLGICSIDSQN